MRKTLFGFAFFVSAAAGILAQPPVPQLPQTYIDTTYHAPGGTTWSAHTSTDFTNVLNSAHPGDTIVLDAGSTYLGNFTLPAKSNPNNLWIYIVSSALASLPAPGTRVNPATDAVHMPKIVTPSAPAAIRIAPGANHYRLVGLEISTASTFGCNLNSSPPVNCYSYQLIFGASVPNQPLVDSITVDRCYLHGSPTQDVRQGIQANGSNFAVIDSYISDIHQSVNDSQAILAYYSPGPLKIVNNYLSATTEDIMFGGGGGLSNPWVPSDIEVRNNHLFKPMSWAQPGVTLPPNNEWVMKNNLEVKSARRVLVDSNILENAWVSGQSGFSVMLTPRTSSSGLSAVVDDLTIQNNILKNVSSGFDTLEFDNACLPSNGCSNPGESRRVKLYNNLVLLGDTTQPGYTNGFKLAGIIANQLTDYVIQHNTFVAPPNVGYCGGQGGINFNTNPPYDGQTSHTHNIWILDNVVCRQIDGPRGFVGQFSYVLQEYMGDPSPVNPRLLGNVMYAPSQDHAYTMPPQNDVTTTPVTYVNLANGNYQLAVPNWTQTSDGQIAGVNNAQLLSN